jgi:hypothetical protein
METTRSITFLASLALIGACSGAPSRVDASQLASSKTAGSEASVKPVAATAPAAEATPGSPAPASAAPGDAVQRVSDTARGTREVTLPAGTVLPVDLETSVGSDTSRVEQPVSGRLRRALTVRGAEVLPAGTLVSGHVTAAQRPGKVKGRGLIAMRFTQLDQPGAGRTSIKTATISRLAPATKEKDALKIIAPATAGAVIGRIAGGKGAAAKGAVIGGGAGAGYVLATRGKDVRLIKGTNLAVRLTSPVTLRIPVR